MCQPLKVKMLCFFKTLGYIKLFCAQHNVPNEQSPQHQCCRNHKSHLLVVNSYLLIDLMLNTVSCHFQVILFSYHQYLHLLCPPEEDKIIDS